MRVWPEERSKCESLWFVGYWNRELETSFRIVTIGRKHLRKKLLSLVWEARANVAVHKWNVAWVSYIYYCRYTFGMASF